MRNVTGQSKASRPAAGAGLVVTLFWLGVHAACSVDHKGLSFITITTGSTDGNPHADAGVGNSLIGEDAAGLPDRASNGDADAPDGVGTAVGSGGSKGGGGSEGPGGGVIGSGGAAASDAGLGDPGSGGGSGDVLGSGGAAGAPATLSGSGGAAGNGGAGGTGSAGGSGATGSGGAAPVPCSSCGVAVKYTCRDPQLREAISFRLRLVNKTSGLIPLSSVTVRYWFTAPSLAGLALACDYAAIQFPRGTCADVVGTSTIKAVSPSRHRANAYLEVGFGRGAGTLDAYRDSTNDQIILRLHDSANVPMDQTDDYSRDCARPDQEIDSPLVTAYVGGTLVFGKEPE